MGGVNLSEESKNILATTNADFIGAQMRSCKDEIFLAGSPLHKKISTIGKSILFQVFCYLNDCILNYDGIVI